ADEVMRLRYREIEHPRSVSNRFRLDDYIPSDGTVLERHRKTISASESRGLDFHNARAPCEQPVDGGNPKRSSALRSDPDETIRKATVENRREAFFDLVSVKSQDRDRIVGMSRSFTGRALRTGQVWYIFTRSPLSSCATTSSTLNVPSRIWATFPPRKFGGTMIRCWTFFASWTVPTTSPGPTAWPGWTFGAKAHDFSRVRPGDFTPRRTKSPITFCRTGRGRWMPS